MATDRRTLMLNSGMASKDVVEVSYQGLQVDNEGLTCSGLQLSGNTDQDYAYYLDHNGRKQIRSRARPLFANACSGKSTPRPTPSATNRGRHTGTANREKLRRRACLKSLIWQQVCLPLYL